MPRKQKQKQKQTQRQSVVVNIHEKKVKKRRAPRRKAQEPLPPPVVLGLPKVPPIVIQYSEPASLTGPVPPPPAPAPAAEPKAPAMLSSMFKAPVKESFKTPARVGSSIKELITPSPASTISSIDWIEPVAEAPKRPIPKGIPSPMFEPIRPSADILRESAPSLEDIIRSPISSQESLRPMSSVGSMKSLESVSSVSPPLGGGGLVSSRVAAIEKKSKAFGNEPLSIDKAQQARLVRQAQQRSEGIGADITDEMLLSGRYGYTTGNKRRTAPTAEQKDRLAKLGKPWKGK